MTNVRYRVYLGIEEVDLILNKAEETGKQFECATFATRSEAQDFIIELLQNHCACASGEADLMAEMTSPEFFTAGD